MIRVVLIFIALIFSNTYLRAEIHFTESFTAAFNTSSYNSGTITLSSGVWDYNQIRGEISANSVNGTGSAARLNRLISGGSYLITPSVNTIETISFNYRELNSGGGTFKVQKSVNGGAFVDVETQAFSGTTYALYTLTINDANNNIRIKILSDNNAGFLIVDELTLTSIITDPTLTINPSSLTNFSYYSNSGPSSSQSFSISGPTTLFLNQSMHRNTAVYKIKKAFDKLEFSEVNTNFYYDQKNPVSKSANVDKPEAVFFNDKFSIEDENGYLVSVDGLFLSEKMDPVKPQMAPSPLTMFMFNLGGLNPTKSKYVDIRSYPNNTDIVVDLSYDNPTTLASGGPDVVDPRYVRVRMQHSFLEMPKNDFRARRDDPRVGYFMQQRTDMTSIGVTPYKDMINRWFLKKKDAIHNQIVKIHQVGFP